MLCTEVCYREPCNELEGPVYRRAHFDICSEATRESGSHCTAFPGFDYCSE